MTENVEDGCGAKLTVSGVYSLYVQARDRISKYALESIDAKKFGGPGQEVHIDFLKLHLRSLKVGARAEEYIVLGFIEKATNRVRGYLVPNCKSQTVV